MTVPSLSPEELIKELQSRESAPADTVSRPPLPVATHGVETAPTPSANGPLPQSRPGELTIFENIPPTLQKIKQWVLWEKEQRGAKLAKIPRNALDPYKAANALDPANWSTFEQARDEMLRYSPGTFGMGFVLTKEANVTCFDFDQKDNPEAFEAAIAAFRSDPTLHTWCEISVSRNGAHFFYLGSLPEGINSILDGHCNIEIYGCDRFIALTGNTIGDCTPDLTDGAGIVDQVCARYRANRKLARGVDGIALSGVSHDLGRSHMSDERALIILWERKPQSFAWLNEAAPQGQGSDRLLRVVGDLDKILADPDQILRIIERSPLGQSRLSDLYRKFHKYWLPDARRSNTHGILNRTDEETAYFTELGRQMVQAMDAHKDALVGPPPPSAFASDVEHGPAQLPGSSTLQEIKSCLMAGFGEVASESSPWMSRLIDVNFAAMKLPFRKFALLSTITFMGGLLGRKYKTWDGLSSSLFFLLAAPTGCGKGVALGFWPKQFSIHRDKNLRRRPNVHSATISSVQAMHGIVQRTGTTIFYKPDAQGELNSVARAVNQAQFDMRDRIYETYDASEFGAPDLMPAASIAAGNRGDVAIKGACASFIWSVTPKAFAATYTNDSLATGLGQRLLVSFHDEHAGSPIDDDEVLRALPPQVEGWLRSVLADVGALDDIYQKASEAENGATPNFEEADRLLKVAESLIIRVNYDATAEAAVKRIEQAVDDVMRGVNNKKLPEHYAIFGRAAMLAKRLALISALLRDRGTPQIVEADVAWGFSFVLDCLVSLAASFDRGESGDATDAAREAAILRWFDAFKVSQDQRLFLNGKKAENCPFWYLKARAQKNKAFTSDRNKGSDELLYRSLRSMVQAGQLVENKAGEVLSYRRVEV